MQQNYFLLLLLMVHYLTGTEQCRRDSIPWLATGPGHNWSRIGSSRRNLDKNRFPVSTAGGYRFFTGHALAVSPPVRKHGR